MLDRIDPRFAAILAGDELNRLPGEVVRVLIDRRILVDAGNVSTIPRCVCDEREPDCVVDVDTSSGACWGRCRMYGVRVEVSPDQIRRYRFDFAAWASWLRRKNGLEGPGPRLGLGALFVGCGKVRGREYGLVVVAPGCRRAADVVWPEGAHRMGRPLVALVLGDPIEELPVDGIIPAASLGADLGTIDGGALDRAMCETQEPPAPARKRPGRPRTADPQAEQVARVIKDRRGRGASYEELCRALPRIKNMRAAVANAQKRYRDQIRRIEDSDGWVTFVWKS